MQWDDFFTNRLEHDPGAPDRTALAASLPGTGGVYLLADEQDRLVQLASAADLRRAVLNRLLPDSEPSGGAASSEQAPSTSTSSEPSLGESDPAPAEPDASPADATSVDPLQPSPRRSRRADLSQIVRRIRWQPAHSAFEIAYEYLRISREIMPSSYLKNLAFGPAWFVHVDPVAEIPRFLVAKVLPGGSGTTLGPFSTQQDANRFVQALEDSFDLCRYIHILEQTPHGQPCAYHEMGRCPAPCGGLIPMSEYRRTVASAAQFATGERGAVLEEWESRMRDAARGLAFERAAAFKQRIERARELDHAAFRFVRPLQEFSWLIVQRGGGRTRLKPFFVRASVIEPGNTVRLKDLDAVVPAWLERMRTVGTPNAAEPPVNPQQVSEQIWLVSHFLFRRERTGLFLDAQSLPADPSPADLSVLAEHIRTSFAPAPVESPDTPPASSGDAPASNRDAPV